MQTFLTQDQIAQKAPSVFTRGSYELTSDRYAPISTFDVLKGLYDLGFGVTHAMESTTRKENRVGYNKHLLRLRQNNQEMINGLYPELVLINAHDGSSSYQLRAGIYRMVCSNGMVLGDEMLCQRVRHQGDVVSRVVEAGSDIIEVFPTAIEKAKEWSEIELAPEQITAYAESAKMLKWEKDGQIEVPNSSLLRRRRYEDQKQDLWTTFNILQENLIKGGVRTRNRETGQRNTTREVKSPHENNRLNTALWTLTDHMASLAR